MTETPHAETSSQNAPQPGFAADCPCELTTCSIRGNCVECVRVHRTNQAHLPECLQPMLRSLIADLAGKVELRVTEGRPGH